MKSQIMRVLSLSLALVFVLAVGLIGSAGTKATQLAKPKSVKVTQTDDSTLKVSWKKVKGAQKYQVYRKVDDGQFRKVATTKNPSFTDKSLAAERTYAYKVRAVRKDGNKTVTGKFAATKRKVIPITTAVSLLVGQEYSMALETPGGGRYRWRYYVSPADGINVTESPVPTPKEFREADEHPVSTVYTCTVQTPGVYFVSFELQDQTDPAKTTIKDHAIRMTVETPQLAAPKSVKVTQTGVSSLKVSWKKVKGAQKYQVYRKVDDGQFRKVTTTKKLSFSDKNLTAERLYTYRVRAVRKNGETTVTGKFSAEKRKLIPVATDISLKVGQAYSVALKTAGSGYYRWFYTIEPSDCLAVTESQIPIPADKLECDGYPMSTVYTFTPQRSGVCTVDFEQKYSNDPNDLINKEHIIHFTIAN